MLVEMLAYVARSERLKISPKAARARHRLPQSRSKDGRALVSVDLAEIEHQPLFGRRVDAFAMKACIDSLQKELDRVEAMAAAAHRADFQRERDRAEHLVAELLKAGADAMADAMAARESTARLEGELLELRSRPWWRRLAGY